MSASAIRKVDERSFAEQLLERYVYHLQAGSSALSVMGALFRELYLLRTEVSETDWSFFREVLRDHPCRALVHEDPFTAWSYCKPRGYAGDAHLLDFIYRQGTAPEELERATALGRAIYEYTSNAPAACAVRERREVLARLVDRKAKERGRPIEVLAIAAGHLREAELSEALAGGSVERWVALDQDAASLSCIEARGHQAVQVLPGSVRGLLGQRYDLGRFDLVYAAGLYDYLVPPAASRLTQIAFEMLKPGGTYLFANFAKDIPDLGYMESFMDWSLILRDADEVRAISESVGGPELSARDVYFGENGNIVYAELHRA